MRRRPQWDNAQIKKRSDFNGYAQGTNARTNAALFLAPERNVAMEDVVLIHPNLARRDESKVV